ADRVLPSAVGALQVPAQRGLREEPPALRQRQAVKTRVARAVPQGAAGVRMSGSFDGCGLNAALFPHHRATLASASLSCCAENGFCKYGRPRLARNSRACGVNAPPVMKIMR